MSEDPIATWFTLFNEIGIVNQLSSTLLEAQLPKGMLRSHFSVLNHLIRVSDGRTPLELSRAFQVPKASMTHTLAGLEKAGFVALRPHPKDGRSKQVWLTEAGRAFRDDAVAALEADIEGLAAEIPTDEVAAALPFLTRLRKVMDSARDG